MVASVETNPNNRANNNYENDNYQNNQNRIYVSGSPGYRRYSNYSNYRQREIFMNLTQEEVS